MNKYEIKPPRVEPLPPRGAEPLPPLSGEITAGINRLCDIAGELDQCLCGIERRLGAVLSPLPAAPKEFQGPIGESLTPMGERIWHLVARFGSMAALIQVLEMRLEV